MYVFIICIYSNASDCQSNTANSNKTLHRMLVCVFTSIYCARCAFKSSAIKHRSLHSMVIDKYIKVLLVSCGEKWFKSQCVTLTNISSFVSI